MNKEHDGRRGGRKEGVKNLERKRKKRGRKETVGNIQVTKENQRNIKRKVGCNEWKN